jgi:hypothetical protein
MPAVRYGVPGLLAGLALAWLLGWGPALPLRAQAAAPAETSGTIAFTAAGPGATQLLFLIDTRSQAFAVYQIDPQDLKGTLKLEAARQYRWDLKLAQYNSQPPEPSAVAAMVEGVSRR